MFKNLKNKDKTEYDHLEFDPYHLDEPPYFNIISSQPIIWNKLTIRIVKDITPFENLLNEKFNIFDIQNNTLEEYLKDLNHIGKQLILQFKIKELDFLKLFELLYALIYYTNLFFQLEKEGVVNLSLDADIIWGLTNFQYAKDNQSNNTSIRNINELLYYSLNCFANILYIWSCSDLSDKEKSKKRAIKAGELFKYIKNLNIFSNSNTTEAIDLLDNIMENLCLYHVSLIQLLQEKDNKGKDVYITQMVQYQKNISSNLNIQTSNTLLKYVNDLILFLEGLQLKYYSILNKYNQDGLNLIALSKAKFKQIQTFQSKDLDKHLNHSRYLKNNLLKLNKASKSWDENEANLNFKLPVADDKLTLNCPNFLLLFSYPPKQSLIDNNFENKNYYLQGQYY